MLIECCCSDIIGEKVGESRGSEEGRVSAFIILLRLERSCCVTV